MDAGGGMNGFSIGIGELDGDPSGGRWPDQSVADPRYSNGNGYAGEELSPRGGSGGVLDGPPPFQGGGLSLSPSAPSLAPLAGGDAGAALGVRRSVLSPLAASAAAAGGPPMENGRPKTGYRRKQRP